MFHCGYCIWGQFFEIKDLHRFATMYSMLTHIFSSKYSYTQYIIHSASPSYCHTRAVCSNMLLLWYESVSFKVSVFIMAASPMSIRVIQETLALRFCTVLTRTIHLFSSYHFFPSCTNSFLLLFISLILQPFITCHPIAFWLTAAMCFPDIIPSVAFPHSLTSQRSCFQLLSFRVLHRSGYACML